MKLKTTKKQIKDMASNLFSVGYCGLDYLLKYHEPFAYSAGVYGWSCDYYNIDGSIISTGYQPIGKLIDYELVKQYNNAAQEIHNKENMEILLNEFIKKINKGD